MEIDIIGVPIDLGADRRGWTWAKRDALCAPAGKARALGHSVNDTGNIEVPIAETCTIDEPNLKYIGLHRTMARRAAGAVAKSVAGGRFPLVLAAITASRWLIRVRRRQRNWA